MMPVPCPGIEVSAQTSGTALSVTLGQHCKPGHPGLYLRVEVALWPSPEGSAESVETGHGQAIIEKRNSMPPRAMASGWQPGSWTSGIARRSRRPSPRSETDARELDASASRLTFGRLGAELAPRVGLAPLLPREPRQRVPARAMAAPADFVGETLFLGSQNHPAMLASKAPGDDRISVAVRTAVRTIPFSWLSKAVTSGHCRDRGCPGQRS